MGGEHRKLLLLDRSRRLLCIYIWMRGQNIREKEIEGRISRER